MSDLYNRIMSLCEEKGVSGYRMCKDIKIQPSILTDLKMGRQSGLSAKNADKMAAYFGVSVGFLLGTETKKAPTDGERDHAIDHVDEELKDYLDELRNRSEMRMLFSVARNANKQKIEAIVKFIEGLEEQK